MEAKDGDMVCAIEGCRVVDETHTAHCIKHGRSTHRIKSDDPSLDVPYPPRHNWKGLTPRQVSEAYEKKSKEPLKLKSDNKDLNN